MKHLLLEHLPPLSKEENQLAEQRWSATTFHVVGGKWSQYLVRKAQKVLSILFLPNFELILYHELGLIRL
jgi:hypothetical protein